MKKTAAAIVLLAGLGGGCTGTGTKDSLAGRFNKAYKAKEVPGVVGPAGEPVVATAPDEKPAAKKKAEPKKADVAKATGSAMAKPGSMAKAAPAAKPMPTPATPAAPPADAGIAQVSAQTAAAMVDPTVQPAAGFAKIKGSDCDDGSCGVRTPGLFAGKMHDGHVTGAKHDHGPAAPNPSNHGIVPAPQMGPPGAVAYVPPPGWGVGHGPAVTNQRTSIRFVSPAGMQITWLGAGGFTDSSLTAPVRYNFPQGSIYRLRLSGIPNQPGRTYYPTLEVAPATPKTTTFLAHNTVPVSFTDEDFERVRAGNLVVKVIYLPEPAFQDLAAGAEEVVSTQLDPGIDPIVEATRRGTIMAIVRLGNIDLQDPNTPAMDAPVMGGKMMMPGMMMPGPGMMAPPAGGPGMMMPGPGLPQPKMAPPGGVPPTAGVTTLTMPASRTK